ncbi:P-loop containing nucleoside triphosphate hydrolase [Vibrio phage 1.263.B._10N.286.51.B1]|nr:P-loop containing nucleoside triphosphate hydrolase [Vibrio phage 1.263.A._10N.286.51.B1]AUR99294.1 P-loop containing nucleoside triphosphate hydrolase [Vibrio phage 1.263.B._10N.286.51.B1]
MSILNIRKAVRTGSRVVIGIAGQSGEGKTYTALKLARGMVNSPEEIGFLDTENKRGSLYADILDGPFLIGDLYAPFSPQRYADAIKEFQDAGVKVLVIDSGSHEHEGEGGLEDIANAPLLAGKRMADWKRAKSEHKKFMNAMLQSDMHIILCLRAREKTDFKNPKQPVSLGIQPICEKNVLFEMTASMMMFNQGQNQQFIKIPEALRPIFGNGNTYLNESHGKALIDWVNSGEKIDEELESFKNKMQFAANSGTESLKQAWLSMPAEMQKKMDGLKKQYWSSAQAFDDIQKSEENHEQDKPVIKQGFTQAKPETTPNQEPQPQQPEPPQEIEEF